MSPHPLLAVLVGIQAAASLASYLFGYAHGARVASREWQHALSVIGISGKRVKVTR